MKKIQHSLLEKQLRRHWTIDAQTKPMHITNNADENTRYLRYKLCTPTIHGFYRQSIYTPGFLGTIMSG